MLASSVLERSNLQTLDIIDFDPFDPFDQDSFLDDDRYSFLDDDHYLYWKLSWDQKPWTPNINLSWRMTSLKEAQ
jgi:hypothetical protein